MSHSVTQCHTVSHSVTQYNQALKGTQGYSTTRFSNHYSNPTRKVLLFAEVTEEARRCSDRGPKEKIGWGGYPQQTSPTPGGCKDGQEGGPRSPAEGTKHSNAMNRRRKEESIQNRNFVGETGLARHWADCSKGLHTGGTESDTQWIDDSGSQGSLLLVISV